MGVIKFVVPAGVDINTQAFEGRPETWRELAEEQEVDIEFEDSDWCKINDIKGLGFVEVPDLVPPVIAPNTFDLLEEMRAEIESLKSRVVEVERRQGPPSPGEVIVDDPLTRRP